MNTTATKTLTDAELAERLKALAVKIFPSANKWAVANGVKNIIGILESVEPGEYAQLHAALFPAPAVDFWQPVAAQVSA